MKHTIPLKQNHEFRRLYSKGKSGVCPYFVIYCRKTGRPVSRLGITTGLKLGNAVVLCLTGTPDALAKRILDFSFGVASALDANVECVGNKVFALTRVNELSEGERSYLRSQGLI